MLYGDQPRLSGTSLTEYRDDTIILERFFARSMPRGHGTLERQSTQSALSIQLGAFHTTPHTLKKQWSLRFVFKIQLSFEFILMNTKPPRLRFDSAVCTIVKLFF